MKYIVCKEPGNFEMGEKAAPIRKNGEALLQIRKVGICGTDLHAYAGNQAFFSYPRILGHELASEVLEIDSNPKGISKGDKVVVIPYINCGQCVACLAGKTNCCTQMKVLGVHTDGGMQEQITVPVELLIPAERLSYEEMAIVEPLAIGAHALRRAKVSSDETIVVLGCGPIGIGIIKLALVDGVRVIAIDRNQQRLDYAKNIGANEVVLADGQAIDNVSQLTNGDMATAVFDATGHRAALESGPRYMAHGGRFVLVGLSKDELSFSHPYIHAKEATLMCSRNATMEDFEKVIALLTKGQFPTGSFITHTVKLSEMIEHFDTWLDINNNVIKATVDF